MAGIPPFIGFISKEFLFQAQLESSWELVPLAIAVIVNAVMVGVAGVITLRPFFLGREKVTDIRHVESFSLVAPPLLLALAGLTISLEPDWITRVALRPAVAAVYGRAVAVDIAVWHGVTPMLLLSLVVVSVGALIVRFWRTIHIRLRGLRRIDALAIEALWDDALDLTVTGSRALTNRLQHGDLRRYLFGVLMVIVALLLWSIVSAGVLPALPEVGDMRAGEGIVALIGLAGAVAAARAPTLLGSMIATGLAGFAVAITFLSNGAPDLALTQFTVEALLVVLLTAVLLAVPLRSPATRSLSMRIGDASLALALGALLFLGMLDMISRDHVSPASAFYGRMSLIEAYGQNVVNVILVDFRAFDTLGETMVIAVAGIVATVLLAARGDADAPSGPPRVHFSLQVGGRALSWLLLAASLVILWRGHNQPGGGFVGGLVAALSFALLALAHGVDRAERALRVPSLALVGAGMTCALVSGLPGLLGGAPYMTHLWWTPGGGLPKLGTTLLFDIGVYLVVLGAVLSFLFGLQREATR